MSVTAVLAVFALVFAFTSLGFGIAIANSLRARGIKANPWLVRFMIFRYMAEYKRVTLSETGQVGSLYYGCAVSGTIALVFAIAMILTVVL
jgi:hypothetical protein